MLWKALIIFIISSLLYLTVMRHWSERKYHFPPEPLPCGDEGAQPRDHQEPGKTIR